MLKIPQQRIFPLLLSPIETFLRADDRPAYPMTFTFQFTFSGQIKRPAFEAALQESLDRHPLLQCFVQPAKRDIPCWVPSPDVMPRVDWADGGTPVTCPEGELIDLASEVGLRIWVRQQPERAQLTMQFHHACCDGIGAFRFIGDLLALYGARTSADVSQKPLLHSLDPARLRHRARSVVALALERDRAALTRAALAQGYQIVMQGGTPLLPPKSGKAATDGPLLFPGICSHTFARPERQALREWASGVGATLNDLLLQELFGAIHQWNAMQRPWHPGRRLRIMMPVNLRTAKDRETPAANMMSYTFISRRASEINDPRQLLESIRDETERIKSFGLGRSFCDTITAACGVSGLLPWALSVPRSMAAAVLSNMGDPVRRFTAQFPNRDGRLVAGNLVLDEVIGVPPMRPRTRATILILSYAQRLTVSLRCDPHSFDLDNTRELLSIYVQRLQGHLSGCARESAGGTGVLPF